MAFPVLAVFETVGKVIDRVFPDKEKQAEAKLKLLEMQQSGELAHLAAETELAKGQMDINKVEAASSNVFVSGWRPFIGWVCGSVFVANYIIVPMMAWLSPLVGIPAPPMLEFGEVMPVLFGILGLGVYRTQEKIKGVA